MQHGHGGLNAEIALEIFALLVLDRPHEIGALEAARLFLRRRMEEFRRDAERLQELTAVREYIVGIEDLVDAGRYGVEREAHPGIVDDGDVVAPRRAGPGKIARDRRIRPGVEFVVRADGRRVQWPRRCDELIAVPLRRHRRFVPGRAIAAPVVFGGVIYEMHPGAAPLQRAADLEYALAVAMVLGMGRRRRHDENLKAAPRGGVNQVPPLRTRPSASRSTNISRRFANETGRDRRCRSGGRARCVPAAAWR